MQKNKEKKGTALFIEAFNEYYAHGKSDGTVLTNQSRLRHFISFIKQNKIKDSIEIALSQKTLDDYISYLLTDAKERAEKNIRGGGIQIINDRCQLVARIINYIHNNIKFRQYKNIVPEVSFNKIQDNRRKEDSKKTEITDEEIKELEKIELSGKEEEYRDLFILQVSCGQRISDIPKLFSDSLNIKDGKFVIETQKEKIDAVILYNDSTKFILDKYKNGFKYIKINNPNLDVDYNSNLKEIARKANLSRRIKYKEQKGEIEIEKEEPLYNII